MTYFLKRLVPFFLIYLLFEGILRCVLFLAEFSHMEFSVKTFIVGSLWDVIVFGYMMIPMLIYLCVLPGHWHLKRVDRAITIVGLFVFLFIILFGAVSEWFFWEEFSSRFNFIAVDYLIYTTEVVGNIRESYPMGFIIVGVTALTMFISWTVSRYLFRSKYVKTTLISRIGTLCVFLCLPVLCVLFISDKQSPQSSNRFNDELAKNGMHSLFAAYLNNELSYDAFYITGPVNSESSSRQIVGEGPEKRWNVVLVVVESLSADYLQAYGNKKNLTPNLDALAEQSLSLTRLYATGTRTIYGLAAITLSIPPTPGNAIVRCEGNEGLLTIGSILKERGYDTKFIYGGFGYFDNMNYFFSQNGYGIVDRSDLAKEEIRFANIWGVCDEDLFARVIKEGDRAHQNEHPFFFTVMTTSNHRPFTYPEGKIDIPSHSGRKGGVKYTDYALAKLIEEARSHSWFENTLFVITADHTAASAGKAELNPEKYRIPLMIFAPSLIPPSKIDTLCSQIDIAPTLLGLLNVSYESRFFGKDLLREKPERAFISNYQKLGYLTRDSLTILKPVQDASFYSIDSNGLQPVVSNLQRLEEAVNYFQAASMWKITNKEKPQV